MEGVCLFLIAALALLIALVGNELQKIRARLDALERR
jgi:hypothetical protein